MPYKTGRIPEVLLIVADDPTADRVAKALADSTTASHRLRRVHRLQEGLDALRLKTVSAVLLSLSLPDADGIEALKSLLAQAPEIPVLILGECDQESTAIAAVENGAQDYLLPGHFDSYSLPRALRNAIERKSIEDALFVEKERAVVTLNSIGDAVLSVDLQGNINFLNRIAEELTGWDRNDALGKPLTEVFRIIDVVTREILPDPLRMAIQENRAVGLSANCVLIALDGREIAIEDSAAPVHDRRGVVIGAVIVFHDVSASRAMQRQMAYSAHHDVLTALPNRLLLNDRIAQAIARSDRDDRTFALMFVDLDHFKAVNDSKGHGAGDKLLQAVAKRLQASLRSSDTVSRQGGDEFVVLLPEVSSADDAARSAEKILRSLAKPYVIHGESFNVSASLGISMYPGDGKDAAMLLHNADMAMYSAKEKDRNNYQFFTAEMNQRSTGRQVMEGQLRQALHNSEFVLHYQAKVNLDSGKITGTEALVRWQHPERGLILPGEFIKAAEDCALVSPIDLWVLREACRQTGAWQAAGNSGLTVAVNVSGGQFRDEGFIEHVVQILEETHFDPRLLQLEITESVLIRNVAASLQTLEKLHQMGIRLAVDDFGTGYSSLNYLRQFPIDVLKIDRSFVQHIVSDQRDASLVSAIVAMGRSLGYVVIAEGIEAEEQKSFLRHEHCEEGQGYLLSVPLNGAGFGQVLEQQLKVAA